MTAATVLAKAEAAGLRFTLAPDGRVLMTAAAEPPADVVQALRQHKADVAALLAMRLAPPPVQPPADWRDMPFGPGRGAAFRSARMAPGACSCCAGLGWWRGADEAGPEHWRCNACHPPPKGLNTITKPHRLGAA
ncbi:MAG: hypothetical protein LW713_10195 [Acetobacteraceae bacterium]|jgi:hypothetical protein|nr:hypothetical protein [Acetobacteraceae bacterium]